MSEPPTAASGPAPSAEHHSDPAGPAEQVRDLARTLRQVHSRYLIGLLLAYFLAAGVGMLVIIVARVRDWYAFAAMFLIVLAYVALYIRAHQRRRRILRALTLAFVELLLWFWIFVLIDRIPARRVFVDEQVSLRPELPMLWVPVVLLGLVAVGLLGHWLYVGRYLERSWEAEASEPAAAEPPSPSS